MATFIGDNIPATKRATRIPGDDLRVTLEAATDTACNEWPKGSKCRPLSGGYSNVHRANVANITMLGSPAR